MKENASTYGADALRACCARLLEAAGLPSDRAGVVADVFVEGELLGYRTHGLKRMSSNLEWLQSGETSRDGEIQIVSAGNAVEHWDAGFLPGPWVVRSAVERASDMARSHGTGTIAISRSQHIACLAAYLMKATAKGQLVIIMASTPSESTVAPHGGTSRVFSCNPLAAGIPTAGDPILIDTSASMSAMGPLYRAHEAGRQMDVAGIVLPDGTASADPASYFDEDGAILPAGGLEQGYKGYALAILIEALSAALTGYGRATPASAKDGEANSVFVQVIDPAHFGGAEGFGRQMSWLGGACRASSVANGKDAVRMPGDRALAVRQQQIREGVSVAPAILAELRRWGALLGVEAI
ncbi:Ldh family oxidoreductase [Aquibium sp. LZ166]|uniref:Ldh family oxidoreductase n=1 Tax=Aquibium pacificus TaxID=3153579 RepID=A0ABV3SMW7_9HYPH